MHPQQPAQWDPQQGQGFQQQPQFQQPQQFPQQQPQFQQWQQVPKKKSRAGCIVLIVLGVIFLLVVGGIAGGYFYWRNGIINEPAGMEPSGEIADAPCDRVSEATLRELRTSNLIAQSTSDGGEGFASCMWRGTKGQDGNNERYLDITLSKEVLGEPEEAVAVAEENFENYRNTDGARAEKVTDVEGPWDEAFLATGTEVKQALLVFRKGTAVVQVGYDGYDKGYSWEDTRMPAADAEKAAKMVAEEFAAGL
ncbi:hypothetical protein [Saccharopolyspora sp. NPDC002686]|uniref:hypothetical protein n=1 Tax=Saccharopolyspora sp. NPDC002686 TaxID=3154541 RepID=UPI003332DE92